MSTMKQRKGTKSKPAQGSTNRQTKGHATTGERLEALKRYYVNSYSVKLSASQYQVTSCTIRNWIRIFEQENPEALRRLPQMDASVLIHHSDRDTQYASLKYTNMLKKRGMQISMTESGDPKENSPSEWVNSAIKDEFLKGKVFRSIDEANRAISKAVATYNTIRSRMSVDYNFILITKIRMIQFFFGLI